MPEIKIDVMSKELKISDLNDMVHEKLKIRKWTNMGRPNGETQISLVVNDVENASRDYPIKMKNVKLRKVIHL